MEADNLDDEKNIIGDKELELTEAELNKIFFDKKPEGQSTENDKQTTTFPSKPIKLKKQKPVDDNLIKKEIDNILKIQIETDIQKIEEVKLEQPTEDNQTLIKKKELTFDKIQNLRKEREERLRLIRDNKRDKNVINSSLKIGKPLNPKNRKELIKDVIETRKEIEEYISDKRENLKKILKDDNIVILNQKSKCNYHLYRIAYFDETGIVAICKKCSATWHFDSYGWDQYLAKNKKDL